MEFAAHAALNRTLAPGPICAMPFRAQAAGSRHHRGGRKARRDGIESHPWLSGDSPAEAATLPGGAQSRRSIRF